MRSVTKLDLSGWALASRRLGHPLCRFERFLACSVHSEGADQSRDCEDAFGMPRRRTDEDQVDCLTGRSARRNDEDSERGGIDEVESTEIDDETRVAIVQKPCDAGAEGWRREEVEFAGDVNHG